MGLVGVGLAPENILEYLKFQQRRDQCNTVSQTMVRAMRGMRWSEGTDRGWTET